MFRPTAAAAAAILILNGALHGVWSHRWTAWSESAAQVERIGNVPLQAGEWDGERIETDAVALPEDEVGRGQSVRYVNRVNGSVVTVFLIYGPTGGIVSHTPRACYPANGYTCPVHDLRVSPPVSAGPPPEFWASTFTKPDAVSPVHLRVLWAWSDGNGWQIPYNARRTFRRTPFLYKVYAIREIVGPDEPLDGDPAVGLLAVLLPRLDAVLFTGR